jgi:hypothetical protein
VLETVTLILELAGRPMRVLDIQEAASDILGCALHPTSIKKALSANLQTRKPRFRRIRHGTYELAG